MRKAQLLIERIIEMALDPVARSTINNLAQRFGGFQQEGSVGMMYYFRDVANANYFVRMVNKSVAGIHATNPSGVIDGKYAVMLSGR